MKSNSYRRGSVAVSNWDLRLRNAPVAPSEALPADLVHLLLTRVGLTEDEVHRLSRSEAIGRLQKYWLEGR